ncbi:SDR family NAD(P)-dependent oxidoreductase [Stella sp.]|uniref:SDR family NAD(P)-dependent oxidoreductase n=1 Tax=Stella sp. TaxID=2912054 RepID=UPI0035B2582E
MSAAPLGLFRGEAAIVTGAAGRIGQAIARHLAAEGATVHLVDRDGPGADALAGRIADQGGRAVAAAVDLSDRAALDAFCTAHLARQGAPDMVVHAACPTLPSGGPDWATGDAEWDQMIEVGVGAARRMVRHFVPAMRRAGRRGRFLLLTSLHAETPRTHAHYSATKAAMTMLTKELARELGPSGIRVNALAPGYVPDDRGPPAPRIPLGRAGTGDDVAGMAAVLLSDRFSAYVTGTTVVVDGGLSLVNWIPRRP